MEAPAASQRRLPCTDHPLDGCPHVCLRMCTDDWSCVIWGEINERRRALAWLTPPPSSSLLYLLICLILLILPASNSFFLPVFAHLVLLPICVSVCLLICLLLYFFLSLSPIVLLFFSCILENINKTGRFCARYTLSSYLSWLILFFLSLLLQFIAYVYQPIVPHALFDVYV